MPCFSFLPSIAELFQCSLVRLFFPSFFLSCSLFFCSYFQGENKSFHPDRAPHRDCDHHNEYIPFGHTSNYTDFNGYATVVTPAWYCRLAPYLHREVRYFGALQELAPGSCEGYSNRTAGRDPFVCPSKDVRAASPHSYSISMYVVSNAAPQTGANGVVIRTRKISDIREPTRKVCFFDIEGGQYLASVNTLSGTSWVARRHSMGVNYVTFGGNVSYMKTSYLMSRAALHWYTIFDVTNVTLK